MHGRSPIPLRKALQCAVDAAHTAGAIMRKNHHAPKVIHSATRHDIKLELDVRCQRAIQRVLRRAFPEIPILGEEGTVGDTAGAYRWVVDPIDGTVNFAHGIPHCCVSVALQARIPMARTPGQGRASASRHLNRGANHESVIGVVYDPFCDELWTATKGRTARLNGRPIHVSNRRLLRESVVSLGFAKHAYTMERMLPTLNRVIRRARKVRLMGAAALGLAYVACGRLDAYLEYGVRIWDIAAGGLLIECAGGEFWRRAIPGDHCYHLVGNNGYLRRALQSRNS